MGQRLIVILALLLMVRPIALVENFACGDETAAAVDPAQTASIAIPNQETPCPDTVQPSEIVESGHRCPCFALMQPELADMTTNLDSFSLFTLANESVETAVALPPTPPPRLV
ncbi:MAG: hypothetical protein IAF02_03255 [Anaerolineae bacterium]|nr:hypothetical protein [Anaerolineae bacterium]